jgi:hypothetical protein
VGVCPLNQTFVHRRRLINVQVKTIAQSPIKPLTACCELIRLVGLGGAADWGDAGTEPVPLPLSMASVVKNESNRARSSFGPSLVAKPVSMRTRASRVDGWSVFSRLIARCVAARAVGDGGRGAGFMACATIKGMVGILHEETTGSARQPH